MSTGYGPARELFQTANVSANFSLYGRWLMETHTPFLALAFAAPFVMRQRAAGWLGLAIVATTVALYLPYRVFDDWSYVRFLLPALPWLIVLSLMVIDHILPRFVTARTGIALAIVVVSLGAVWISKARQHSAFGLVRLERHFFDAGTYVAEHLSDRTAILTVRHSGSVHYYSQRPIVSWDTLEPGSLDRALDFLRAQQLRPILLLDTSEESTFRARFEAGSVIGRLDWPPIAGVGRTIRVYDPADRARYFADASVESVDRPIFAVAR